MQEWSPLSNFFSNLSKKKNLNIHRIDLVKTAQTGQEGQICPLKKHNANSDKDYRDNTQRLKALRSARFEETKAPQLCEYLNQICWYNIGLEHTNVPPVFLQEQLCWWAELLIWFLSEKITIRSQNSKGKHTNSSLTVSAGCPFPGCCGRLCDLVNVLISFHLGPVSSSAQAC